MHSAILGGGVRGITFGQKIFQLIKALKINIFGHDLVILHERDIRKK